MSARLDRCRRLLEGLRVDGIIVTDPVDVRYLSGFRGDDATLVVGRAAALLCTDSRFWEQVARGGRRLRAEQGHLRASARSQRARGRQGAGRGAPGWGIRAPS